MLIRPRQEGNETSIFGWVRVNNTLLKMFVILSK